MAYFIKHFNFETNFKIIEINNIINNLMNNMLVSILIPCYNGNSYIPRCINSCLQQTYKNIEIIVIDDGSIDNSFLLLKEFEKKDQRIKVFSQPNQGLGETRNILISKASGEYFFFLDIDDLIPENAIENLVNASNNGQTNVVVGRSLILLKKHVFPFIPSWWRVKEMSAEHYVKSNICTPWGQIIKTSFFRSLNVKFVKGEIFEDIGLMSYIFMKSSDSFSYIKNIVYKYQVSKNKDKLSSFKDRCNIKMYSIYKQTENLLGLFDYDNMLNSKEQRRFINGTFYQIFTAFVFVSNRLNRKTNMSLNLDIYQAMTRFNIFSIIYKFGFQKIKFSKSWWKLMSYFFIRIWYRKIFSNFSSSKIVEENGNVFINNKFLKKKNKIKVIKWDISTKVRKKNIYEVDEVDLDNFVGFMRKFPKKTPSKILVNLDIKNFDEFINKYYYHIARNQIMIGLKLDKFYDYEKLIKYFTYIYSDNLSVLEWLNEHELKIITLSSNHKNDYVNLEVI